MLIGEPPRTPYDLNFSLLGIPVRVHPFFWLVALMLNYRLGDVASVLTWIAAVFLAILVHELGHASVMRAYGFRPWITLYGFGGLASYDQGQAYRSKGSGPLGQVLICSGGSGSGLSSGRPVAAGARARRIRRPNSIRRPLGTDGPPSGCPMSASKVWSTTSSSFAFSGAW